MLFGRPSPEDDRRARAWKQWLARKHPLAIASLVLGIISFVEFGVLLVLGIAGIVLGAIALRQIKHQPSRDGSAMAWWGVVLSIVSLIVAMRFAYRWI